jgi:hypothetical protein
MIGGPIWLEKLSELSPAAHAVSIIRLALQQSQGIPRPARRLNA